MSAQEAQRLPAPPFADLLQQARTSAPRLIESRANVDVSRGRAKQAGALPNPVVSLEGENLGVRDAAGLSQTETTLSVSQLLELGGKRSARMGAGAADVKAAEARAREAWAAYAYDLALAYGAAEAAQRRVDLRDDDLGRAREDARAARALVDAGKEADVRAVQADAAAAATEADLSEAQAESLEAFGRLSSLVGANQLFSEISTSLLEFPFTTPTNRSSASETPILQAAQAEQEAARLRLDLERSRAIPDLTLSLGARRLEGLDDTGIVASVSVPLPLFDQNRGSSAAARAEVAAADARLAGARIEVETAKRAAETQIQASEGRLKAATQAEAAARTGYDLARTGYDAGKTPLIELLAARRAFTEAQDRLLDAQLARLRAEAALARLAGRSLTGE